MARPRQDDEDHDRLSVSAVFGEERPGASLGIGAGDRIVGQAVALAVRHGDRAIAGLAVEAVIGVRVIDDVDQAGLGEACCLQLAAVLREGPIVLVADQDQERHGNVAIELRRQEG